jgi:hypothetical protein
MTTAAKTTTIIIEAYGEAHEVVTITGSVLNYLKGEGFYGAQMLGKDYGTLGNAKGSFIIKN